jgi:hypothetical protein
MTYQSDHPLRSPPGCDLIDAICISADQRERMQAAQPGMLIQAMAMMMQQQKQMLQVLTALVARMVDENKAPEASREDKP